MSEDSIISLQNVNKWFGDFHVLKDVDLQVKKKERIVVCGPSGSGKSTIVRCLSRLIEPTVGEILLDEENLLGKSEKELIEIRRHKMGMVFQNFGLLPHLNVIENIAFH